MIIRQSVEIAVIREAGLSIPSNISVAGYDGISLIQRFPAQKLTTYAQDMSGIGKAAARAIVDQIGGQECAC